MAGFNKSSNAGAASSHENSLVDKPCSHSREPFALRWTSARSRVSSPLLPSGSSSFGWWFWPRRSPHSHIVYDPERHDSGATRSIPSLSAAILASTSCGTATQHHQRRLWMARSLSMISMAACVALVVISIANPPDWKNAGVTTGNGIRYVDDGVGRTSGGGDSGGGGGVEGRGGGADDTHRRVAAEVPGRDRPGGTVFAGDSGGGGDGTGSDGGGGTTNGLLAPPPPCSEPLYGAPPPLLLDGVSPHSHPYIRPLPDPEMAEHRSRVEAYLASPAFRRRVQWLEALGTESSAAHVFGIGEEGTSNSNRGADDSPRGAANCEGCAAEGVLISAGGPRLLTNLLVLLRVLRFHLNSTLPVEISWTGPREMPGKTGNGTAAGGREEQQQQQEAEQLAGEAFINALRDAGLGPVYGMDLSRVPYPEHHRRPPELTHWGAKVYSLLASSRFRRVLLLDADNLPLDDPRVSIFNLLHRSSGSVSGDGEGSAGNGTGHRGTLLRDAGKALAVSGRGGGGGMSSNGVVIWSDAWRGWAGPAAYRELGLDPEAASLALNNAVMVSATGGSGDGGWGTGVASGGGWRGRWGRRDAESGAVLIDRAAHADVLEYLWWINSFGDRLYHRLLHGDKDTFALAFAAAGKAQCYSQVAVPPGAVFRWGKGVLQLKTPPTVPATDVFALPESTPSQQPPLGDGWQLVGFTQQHPATGQPLLLHRTMNKWPALKRSVSPSHPTQHPVHPARGPEGQVPQQSLRHRHQREPEPESGQPGRSWTEGRLQAAEQVWPIQVLTGPLPTGWCDYYLAHDNWGPTKGVLWDHVVPEAALQLVLHPAYGAAEAGWSAERAADNLGLMAAAASVPTNVTQRFQLCETPQRYVELLQGALVGLPTARSAAAEALHAACGPLLRATIERAAGHIHIHVHTEAAAAAAAAARRPSESVGSHGGSTPAGSALKPTSATGTRAGKTAIGNSSIGIGEMRRRKHGQSSAWRLQPVQHRKRSLKPSVNNAPAAAAALAAATEIMSPPWSVQNWCLARALAETLLPSSAPPLPPQRRQEQLLPSWPSLHAAVLRTCLTEPYLERPYTVKSPPPSQPLPLQPPQPHLEGQLQPSAESSARAELSFDSGDSLPGKDQRHDFRGAGRRGVATEFLAAGFQPAPPSVPGWPLPPPPLAGLAVCVEAPRRGAGGDQRVGKGPTQSRSLASSGSAQPASPPLLNAWDTEEEDRCDGALRKSSSSSSKGSSSSGGSSSSSRKSGKAGSGKMGSGGEMEPGSWWRLAAGKDEQFAKWTWPRRAVGTKCGADVGSRPGEEDSEGSGDVRSTNREICDPWVLSAAALDDPMLGSITAAYREHEWVLAAADRGDWPQLLDV